MTRRVRILVDGHVFDDLYQGSRTFLAGLYRHLALSSDFEVIVAAQNIAVVAQEFAESFDRVRTIPLRSRSAARRLLLELPEMARRYRVDFAHFQYVSPPTISVPTILTIHDVLFLEFPKEFGWLYRQKRYPFGMSAKRSAILTTDSEFSRWSIERHLGIANTRIHVVRPALDPEFVNGPTTPASDFAQSTAPTGRFVLYVSRIEPRKNHEAIVEAFRLGEWWKRNVRLVFVGKTAIPNPRLTASLANLPDEARHAISHHQSISRQDLMELYRTCSVFVYPSKGEGFGYPPLEAAAIGAETVVSNATSLREFEFFGDRFVEPSDVAGLREKVETVLFGPGLAPSASEIQSAVCLRFRWDVSADRFSALIKSKIST